MAYISHEYPLIDIIFIICFFLSFLCSVLLLITYACQSELRTKTFTKVAWMALCLSFKFLFSALFGESLLEHNIDGDACTVSASVGIFFFHGTVSWYIVLTVNLLMVVHQRTIPPSWVYVEHFIVWTIATTISITGGALQLFEYLEGYRNCWWRNVYLRLIDAIPLTFAFLLAVFALWKTHTALHSLRVPGQHRRRILRHILWFVGVFVVFSVGNMIDIWWTILLDVPTTPIKEAALVGLILTGVGNFVVWTRNPIFVRLYCRNRFCKPCRRYCCCGLLGGKDKRHTRGLSQLISENENGDGPRTLLSDTTTDPFGGTSDDGMDDAYDANDDDCDYSTRAAAAVVDNNSGNFNSINNNHNHGTAAAGAGHVRRPTGNDDAAILDFKKRLDNVQRFDDRQSGIVCHISVRVGILSPVGFLSLMYFAVLLYR
jgi:hypothetical protein